MVLKIVSKCRFSFKVRFLIHNRINVRHVHLNECYMKQQSAKLFPDVEELLDSGEIKHRKHPGVRKLNPIVLPPKLLDAMNKVISKDNEKVLLNAAAVLMKTITSRRLPADMEEINWKIKSFLHSSGVEDAAEELTREQLIQLRKKIAREVNRWKPIEYDYHQCLVYLVGRLPQNYASVLRVFSEIKSQDATFKPKTFFDFGSGIGSAVWAANTCFGESLKEYFCVDTSSNMNDLAETLLTDEHSEEMHVKNLYFRQFLPASDTVKYDLVISAFSLLDLPSTEERLRVIDTLWRKTKDILVIIEFGNFAGFFSVLDARDYILHIENQGITDITGRSTGAHVLLPCPHELSCPMLEGGTKRSCGFYVSYETIFPRQRPVCKKDWISCVVLRRGHRTPDTPSWPRIVKPVLRRSQHAHCRVCCSDGKINPLIITKSKHGRHAYRCVRSSTLGDFIPLHVEPSMINTETDHQETKEEEKT